MSRLRIAVLGGLAVCALLAAGFHAGRLSASGPHAAGPSAAPAASRPGERRVLYWHDPMVPGQRFDHPGKSPFMDMELVPVYAQDGADTADTGVRVDPAVQHNLGMRIAPVRRVELSSGFDAIGTVQFDERRTVAVQTRVAGYVERLQVRAPMERVHRGQALATVYAPDWLGPQNEFLALKRAGVSDEVLAAARDRMRALSIPDDLLQRSEAGGTAEARFTLSAPVGGVIADLGVREGMAIAAGTTLFRIAGLDGVWAVADVPEVQAVRLLRGAKVQAVLQADAAQTFDGELKEIIPQVNASTRTLQARFEVDNRRGQLMPGMLLRLQVAGVTASRLVVPSEAIIRTGKRALVLLRTPSGSFKRREVTIGAEVGDDIEVVQGLDEGEQVVASGQFLIDSEASLRSAAANPPASSAMAPASEAVR